MPIILDEMLAVRCPHSFGHIVYQGLVTVHRTDLRFK
uniref:Uncharacterized protein n=1 Tax=Anguilla anguilla TaxID=7936 RepID=A0A0E9VMA8_ANGAN